MTQLISIQWHHALAERGKATFVIVPLSYLLNARMSYLSHKTIAWFLCLCQGQTVGRQRHYSLGNMMFWKQIDRLWCKLAQVIHGARTWNGQLWVQEVRDKWQILRPGGGDHIPWVEYLIWHHSRPPFLGSSILSAIILDPHSLGRVADLASFSTPFLGSSILSGIILDPVPWVEYLIWHHSRPPFLGLSIFPSLLMNNWRPVSEHDTPRGTACECWSKKLLCWHRVVFMSLNHFITHWNMSHMQSIFDVRATAAKGSSDQH